MSSADSGSSTDPQLYLEELTLQDCTCTLPVYKPHWRRKVPSNITIKNNPSHRGGHTLTYISAEDSNTTQGIVILFGGSNRQAQTFNDVWSWDIATSTWSYRPCSGTVPSVRSGHVATFVPSLTSLVVHGGQYVQLDKSTGDMDMKFRADTYKLNISTWTWSRIETNNDGPERNGHTWVLHEIPSQTKQQTPTTHSTLILFGGSDRNGPSNQVWTLDLVNLRWSQITTTGVIPEARELHSACLIDLPSTTDSNVKHKYMCVVAGRGLTGLLNTFHILSLPQSTSSTSSSSSSTSTTSSSIAAWSWRLVGMCPARCAHSLLPCQIQDQSHILLFGGTDGAVFFNDVLVYNFSAINLEAVFNTNNTTPTACSKCQGPAGWTLLPDEDKNAAQQAQIPAKADGNEEFKSQAPLSKKQKEKERKLRKKKRQEIEAPPTRFAHAVTAIAYVPIPPTSFSETELSEEAEQPADTKDTSSSSSSASSSNTPAVKYPTFVLFGGMNDEMDLNDTYTLTIASI